ncbi:MAG TPA: hypothetical protein VFV89_22070 [Nocardioides sp.]|uniref:hypothetical protein n=1 Tax=Nocardioides sp. TaxID=35761 RepID=UPI002E301588|nr:hypothetical protein [Nocardioides sp.]HEX5090511.1 hypothetical protein [Nocardioides sp.]
MTTEKPTVEDVEETSPDTEASPEPPDDEPAGPSWWHRDHPTFTALTGFFTGLLFVALVPATYVAVLSLMFDNQKVEDLFPFVLVTLVVPLALVVNQRTRRFGTYFWIGIVLTAVVVVGVAALVLWYLVDHQT